MSIYPEHEKARAILDKSHAIGAFIDWLSDEKDMRIFSYNPETERYDGPRGRIEDLLAEFFEIDLKVLEAEKRAMLRCYREGLDRE